MRFLTTPPPRLTEEEIRQFIHMTYGLEVTAQRLVSDIGQNFHLRDQSNREYIFKIANPAEREDVLEAQNGAFGFLADRHSSYNYPRVLASTAGLPIVMISSKEGQQYSGRLLTFIQGSFLADIDSPTSVLLQSVGRFLGEMDRALSAFHHPAAYRHWHWDVKHAHEVGRHTNCIPQPDKRRLAEYFFLQFESSAFQKLADCRTSVIHG